MSSSQPSDLAAGKAQAKPAKKGRSAFDVECARLRLLLADQIEKNSLREARETVLTLLCLHPNDPDGLSARELIEEQLAGGTTHPVGEIRRLLGHQSAVNTLAISPDGRLALSGSGTPSGAGVFRSRMDYTVRVWNVETGAELRRFLGHSSMVSCVAFSDDGKQAASGGQEGGVYVWDVETGQPLRRIGKRLPHVHAVLFSRDGKSVFTASHDRTVRLWDVDSGERVNRYEGHSREVTGLALSPDSRQLVTSSLDGTVRVWETVSGQMVHRLNGHNQGVLSLAINPDGTQAVSGGEDHTVRLWDLARAAEMRVFLGHTYSVFCVAFWDNGRAVISGGDNTVRLWDVKSGKETKCLEGHSDSVLSVAVSPDGDRALTGGRDMSLRYWQLPSARVNPLSSDVLSRLEEIPALPVPEWVDSIRKSRLLEPTQEKELVENVGARLTNPAELLRHVVERGWLTAYQIAQIADRKGHELRLGNYLLLRPLGAGGMGQVFKVRRFGTTDEAALKIVLPEMTRNEEAVKRFVWEIQALARMSHPNIIRTYDAGAERGRHYFTMEYVEGTDLSNLVKQYGPLPVARACNYIRQAALGLEHAHEHCLIHRDIKPANLLLTLPVGQTYQPGEAGKKVGSAGVVKVLDWGLAGLRPPTLTDQPATRSSHEESTGTVDYMSPEQAMDMGSTDIRADIYSLGCSLYHLLTGKAPFHGFNYVMKLHKHQTAEPTPASELRPEVPVPLQDVMKKMMAKRPEDRYRTPALVAGDLARFSKE